MANITKGANSIKSQNMEKERTSNKKMWYSLVFLEEKVKAGNVMYVDDLNHNLLSVIQMCDQGNEVVF